MMHEEIAARFNALVGPRYRTLLIGGAVEPLYLPPSPSAHAEIRYTRDYAQSALHELAHWCIAGPERRQRPDYGYWYQPPPRDAVARARFFVVESRAQGLELLLARAAGVRFHVSVDDPGAESGDFAARVEAAARAWLAGTLARRTREVLAALNPRWRQRIAVEGQ
jgi:elongation factor P hydroxylase